VLRFLLDEHLRGPLWLAIQRHNAKGRLPIEAIRVGDIAELPVGSDDVAILEWASRDNRILISEDVHTMPIYLAQHCAVGRASPGIIMLRTGWSLAEIVDVLELVAHAGQAVDYENTITFLP